MKFRADVEPTEPMRGLEVPQEVVGALGGGKRPPVTITINGHSWKSRIAIMRGRCVIGLSNANRQAAGVATGDEVEVEVELDVEPRIVVEPTDFAHALDADPAARAAYGRLSYSRKREHVRAIESAKKPETRSRRIEAAVANLRDLEERGITVLIKGARAEHGRILATAGILADLHEKGHLFDDLDAAIVHAKRHVHHSGRMDDIGAA